MLVVFVFLLAQTMTTLVYGNNHSPTRETERLINANACARVNTHAAVEHPAPRPVR